MTVNGIKKRTIVAIIAVLMTVSVITLSLSGCQTPDRKFEINAAEGDYGGRVYEYMQTLANDYPARTMATEGERKAAEYISSVMSGLGYTSEYEYEGIKGLDGFKLGFTRYDGSSVSDAYAYNVIFEKKASSESSLGEILLMCQYDNLYSETDGEKEWQADGSYESGGAVAVMLTLAETLKDKVSDYDLTFAFFTGGSYTWMGAKQYIDNLKRADLDNLRLAINFSMLFGGSNLYLYTSEKETSYGNFMTQAGSRLTQVPKDKSISFNVLTNDAILNYVHAGMLGNHYYLINKQIPVANFLSLDWSCKDNPMMTEMKGKTNVYHSKDDTFATLKERKGEQGIKDEANGVMLTCLTVLDPSNSEVLSSALAKADDEGLNLTAQSARTNSLLNIILKIVLIAAIFAVAGTVKRYVQKHKDKYIPQTEDEPTNETPEPFSDAFDDFSKSKSAKPDDTGIKQDDDFKDDPFV